MNGRGAPQSQLPGLEIRVNGRPLPQQARRDLRQATVDESLEAASMFTLLLYNWDESRLRFTWSDDDLFAPRQRGGVALRRRGSGGKSDGGRGDGAGTDF